jgi:peptidoglycan/xylan/chitin deacetylase (PgdA/CDA1 family)
MYHAVFPRANHETFPTNLTVTPDDLRWQLSLLRRLGYKVITFDDLLAAYATRTPISGRSVLITFDDAYDGLFEWAHPVFAEVGVPYSVFVVTDLVGKTNEWDREAGVAPTPLLSWDKIRRMDESGLVSFYPHTLSHPHLTTLSDDELFRQISRSRQALQDVLGKHANVFCYPFGDYDDRVVDSVRAAGFDLAVTMDRGRALPDDNPLTLPRISVEHRPGFTLRAGFAPMIFLRRLMWSRDKRQSNPK